MWSAIEESGLVLVFHSCSIDEGLVGPIARHYKKTRPYWHATFYAIMFGFPIEALIGQLSTQQLFFGLGMQVFWTVASFGSPRIVS